MRGSLKEREYLENLGTDEEDILKSILNGSQGRNLE